MSKGRAVHEVIVQQSQPNISSKIQSAPIVTKSHPSAQPVKVISHAAFEVSPESDKLQQVCASVRRAGDKADKAPPGEESCHTCVINQRGLTMNLRLVSSDTAVNRDGLSIEERIEQLKQDHQTTIVGIVIPCVYPAVTSWLAV